jgi:hypothetical protein
MCLKSKNVAIRCKSNFKRVFKIIYIIAMVVSATHLTLSTKKDSGLGVGVRRRVWVMK